VTQPTASELADELEALSKAATAGPWVSEGRSSWDSRKPGADAFAIDGPGWGSFAKFVARVDEKESPEGAANRDLAMTLRNNLPTILSALRRVDGMERVPVADLIADLERRAASCCELKAKATTTHDAHRLMGKEAAYLHAAELARAALTGEAQ